MLLKELLRVIDDIKKDLAYTQRLEERWSSEQKRFPLIYKYIIKQREFFQEKIDGAFAMEIDDSRLDDYVATRPGVKVQKLKTAQVSPPQEAREEISSFALEDTARIQPESLQEKTDSISKPAIKQALIDIPVTEQAIREDDEAVQARKALDEAAAEAAKKLRQDKSEPSTQSVSSRKDSFSDLPDVEPAKQAGETDEKASSRDKLRKLASEVLNEVKRSKDG